VSNDTGEPDGGISNGFMAFILPMPPEAVLRAVQQLLR
jgi:hypothetical protein